MLTTASWFDKNVDQCRVVDATRNVKQRQTQLAVKSVLFIIKFNDRGLQQN